MMSHTAGTTLRFCDAVAIVGVSVIDSSGSTRSASIGLIAPTRFSTSSGDVGSAPVTIRNASAFHRLVPVSTNDGTLINGANCAPTYHGTLLGFWSVNCRSPISSPNEAKQSAKWAAEGIRYARRHPGRLLAVVVPVRIMRTLDLWRPAQQVDLAEGRVRWVEAAGQACFWLLVPLAVYGAVLMRRRRALLWPLGVPPLLALTMSVTGYGYPRFRFTADLVITILAGVALAKLLPAGTRRRA